MLGTLAIFLVSTKRASYEVSFTKLNIIGRIFFLVNEISNLFEIDIAVIKAEVLTQSCKYTFVI